MTRRRVGVLLGLVVPVFVAVWLLWNPRQAHHQAVSPAIPHGLASTAVTPSTTVSVSPPAKPDAPPAASPTPEAAEAGRILLLPKSDQPTPLFPHEAERSRIYELASTFEAEVIPQIAVYLAHADPLVREAARLGLTQIGSDKGAPYLMAAAAKATDPTEAKSLREAAEFLRLPSLEDALPTLLAPADKAGP